MIPGELVGHLQGPLVIAFPQRSYDGLQLFIGRIGGDECKGGTTQNDTHDGPLGKAEPIGLELILSDAMPIVLLVRSASDR
jgi:hypothetical protein